MMKIISTLNLQGRTKTSSFRTSVLMHTPAVSSGAVALLISMSTRGQAGGTEVILQLHMSPPVMFGNSSKGVIAE